MVHFKAVLIVLLFTMSLPFTDSQQTACRDATVADIFLVVDGSSNLHDRDFEKVKEFLYTFVNGLDIARDRVRIGLVQYSDDPKTEFLLNQYSSKKNILDYIQNLLQKSGGINVKKALEFLQSQHLVPSAGYRTAEGVKQIAILVTSGVSNKVAEVAAQLRNKGVTIYVIGINVQSGKELQDISSRPSQKYVHNIANFNMLSEFSSSFLESVCRAVVDHIQAFAVVYADVVFLVDGSQNMGPARFQQIRNFIFRTVSQLEIGADKFQVGLAQYSTTAQTEFLLNTLQTKAQVTNYIRNVDKFAFQGGNRVATGSAINFLGSTFFQESAGSRKAQGVPQIAIIITSRPSQDDVTQAAMMIRIKGVKVISIGMKNYDQTELEKIAFLPRFPFVFPNKTSDGLVQLLKPISNEIKQIVQEEFLYRDLMGPAECLSASLADIVFLVDESDDIGAVNFQLLRVFLQNIIYALDIGAENVHIGLAQYSSIPTEEFNLKTYRQKSDILDHVRLAPYRGGGRMTGTAIDFVRRKYFTAQADSRARKGIPQIMVLITSGESQDKVEDHANFLRRQGVIVYASGIGNATMREMEKIASYPPSHYVSRVEDFTVLSPIVKTLQRKICKEIIKYVVVDPVQKDTLKQGCIQTEEADIFFLIDGSSSIYPVDFKDVLRFLIEVVNVFNIGADQVRIGVVQYSTDRRIEFGITEHTNKSSLERAISQISQIFGNTWTGRALSYMKGLFGEAERSRGHKVPRFLITITDGESDDDVSIPAAELIKQGITSYAIGVGQAIEDELQLIGGAKERVYYVTNFDALKDVKSKIVQEICSKDACRKLEETDIIFLIDGSTSINANDFGKMKNFMNSIVNKTTIGPEHVHIGLIQFSSTPRAEFQLDDYSVKVDLHEAINNIQQLKGNTYTGQALTFTADYFATSKGGRPHIPQYLIVITDGEAQDEVRKPAETIRNKGVTVIAVGVSKANYSQLLEIGGTLDKVHYIENFTLLEDLGKQIFWKICSRPDTCLKTDGADIVFVIDGSSNTQPDELERMKSFMMTMVNSSTVSPNNVQFGAILYTNLPNVQFHLNQFRSKREILKSIAQMQSRGEAGDTALALEQAKQLFAIEKGCRRLKGVSQFIIVMTSGEATELLQDQLLADIRESEVTVFTVTARGNEEAFLRIGDANENYFTIQDFFNLGDATKKISQLICNKTNPECDLQEADIVFLVDGSESITAAEFDIVKSFLKDLVNVFTIDLTKTQFGLMQFSTNFQKIFDLKDFSENIPLLDKIEEMVQMNEGTKIGWALSNSTALFTREAGSRKARGVPQFLLVLTDGKSFGDDVVSPAEHLRGDKINIFAVGIGKADRNQLLQISGTRDNVFYVEKFEHLNTIKKRIIRNLCKDRFRGACNIDITMGIDLSNLVEILNTSGSQQKLQMHLDGIIERMMDLRSISCRAGPNLNTRIVFQRSSSDLPLDFRNYDSKVVKKELQLLMMNPVPLTADYLLSFLDIFEPNNVKVIVMFTDGIDDDMEGLKKASERLRLNGVNALIMVSLEETENTENLAELEFGRGFSYRKKLTINKRDIGNVLLSELDTVAERKCCEVNCKCLGLPGKRGHQGNKRPDGNAGEKGSRGYAGQDGSMGKRGYPGVNGDQGADGCQGTKGPKGSRGYRGGKGDNGNDSVDGINGEEGESGIPGGAGEKGTDGNTGSKGARGHIGERGEFGLPGDTGVPGIDNYYRGKKGEKGQRGSQGEFGISGRPGEVGFKGNKGQAGRRGVVGRKGSRGRLGNPGSIGPPGFQGLQGSQGIFGSPGIRGERGLTGAQGSTGIEGSFGPKGSQGFKGQKGDAGSLGQKGEPGRAGSHGPQGIGGIDEIGIPGPKGRMGAPGYPGYRGLQGQVGVPGNLGGRGPKGSRGSRGVSGQPGVLGSQGETGHPGTKGLKGPPGIIPMKPCELLSYIQNHCPCCSSRSSVCPVYPLDLVFALDMSRDVTLNKFNRMKKIVTDLVQNLKITESTCPEGARVAVLTYNSLSKMFIRFSEFTRKQKLVEALQNLTYERTASRQNIGAAMRFAARNVFKHARSGILVRKVAVFLTSGPSQERSSITTAALEFSALGITPVVISFADVPEIQRAFQVDDTRMFQVIELSRQRQEALEQLRTIQLCTFCFDMCRPNAQCRQVISPPPIPISMDIAFVVDGSRNMKTTDFKRMKGFLSTMLDMFVISRSPRTSDNRARVALLQHLPAGYLPRTGAMPVKLEFGFLQYGSKSLMKQHIEDSLNKLDGYSGVGHAIEWAINNVFMSGSNSRRYKVIFLILAGETSAFDMEKLRTVSRQVRCRGFVIFTLFLGKETVRSNLEEIVSFPFDHHLIHLGQLLDSGMTYAQRFARAFLKSLTLEINEYPNPDLQEECQTEYKTREVEIEAEEVEGSVYEEFINYPQRTKAESEASVRRDEKEFEEYVDGTEVGQQTNGHHDMCTFSWDMGGCQSYVLRWYFDQSLQACDQFWYGGCGGNKNRFNTQDECEDTCLKSH